MIKKITSIAISDRSPISIICHKVNSIITYNIGTCIYNICICVNLFYLYAYRHSFVCTLCSVEPLYLFLSLKCLNRGRVRNIGDEIPWWWSLPECFASSVGSFTSTLNVRVTGNSMDYGPRRLRPGHWIRPTSKTDHVECGPYIITKKKPTDVRGVSIFICFPSRSTCNCFHTFHSEIDLMYNVYIIIWKCWYIYKHVCMKLKYITPRSM